MALSRYVALQPLRHSNVDYAVGDPLGLSPTEAASLVAAGIVAAQAGAVPAMPRQKVSVMAEVDSVGGEIGFATIPGQPSPLLLSWAYAQSFRVVSAARDSNGAITTASIVWPDGATGAFTAMTLSTAFPGAIDAWSATYVRDDVTRTVTQPAVTRNSDGAVTVQPEMTITGG